MRTVDKKKILLATKRALAAWFKINPAPAHDYTHAARVAGYAAKIARAEKADVFLSELAGWLHDLGRGTENTVAIKRHNTHHELSYQICRRWFRRNPIFAAISRRDKLKILYAIRYHWNNAADKYPEAIILRDADKLDTFGKTGIKRSKILHGTGVRLLNDFRYKYDCWHWLITPAARRIATQQHLMATTDNYYLKLLRHHVHSVRL